MPGMGFAALRDPHSLGDAREGLEAGDVVQRQILRRQILRHRYPLAMLQGTSRIRESLHSMPPRRVLVW